MRFILILILLIGFVSAYTAQTYDSVDLVLEDGYTAQTYDSVDLVLGDVDNVTKTISISRIWPTTNVNVTQNEFFNVTLNVTCLTGSCGTINVSLDPEPIESHTASTDTFCNDGVCNKVLYSGTRNVFEDNQWKKIEDARSLKDKGFDIVYLEDDGTHEIDVVDFNMTYIEFDFSYDETNLGEYESEIEDGKMKTKWKIVEEVCNETECWDEETEYEIEIEEGEKQTVIYNENPFGKEFHFGENSTTIKLQDADTENLEDNFVVETNPTANADASGTSLYAGESSTTSDNEYITYIKFDSNIISGEILSSIFAFFVSSNAYDTGENPNMSINGVNSQSWSEDLITWNNKPSYNASYIYYNDSFDGDDINFWVTTNVTDWVDNQQYEDNISFGISASLAYSTNDYIALRSKEYATVSNRPYLNITYTDDNVSESKSGLINTTIGALPFYTNSTNPKTTGSLSSGQSETVTFFVNATGSVDVTHDFFAWANITSNESISDTTTNWNVTIVSAAPPADTCTYTSGNWVVDCSDNCDITSNVNLGGNDLILSGVGYFNLVANISNWNQIVIHDSNDCSLIINGGFI